MPKKIRLEEHLEPEELEHRYRKAKDPVERTHYQIVWLLSEGKTTREVMDATGYSRGWVQQVAKRYNARGARGLGDRRHQNPGGSGRALLTEEHQRELSQALKEPPPDGGMWNSGKVAKWIEERTGRSGVRAQRGWEYLRKLGNSPQVPRPAHAQADPEKQEAFKKASRAGSADPGGTSRDFGAVVDPGRDALGAKAGGEEGLGTTRPKTRSEGKAAL